MTDTSSPLEQFPKETNMTAQSALSQDDAASVEAPICAPAQRWRNVVDRDVITLNADGVTGTSARTGQVSAYNMRLVRVSDFWEPIP